jgi:hypothetical protein
MKQDAARSKASARAEYATHTLWSAVSGGERYFVVPDEIPIVEPMPNAPVPEGMFELGTLGGRKRLVREEEVRAFQVSRDRAAEWLLIEFEPAIQQLKERAVATAERMLEEAARDSRANDDD